MILGLFESLHISAIYFGTVLFILLFFEAGFQIGVWIKRSNNKEDPSTLASMVGGLLGLLAFVLAFAFSVASTNHNLRKQNVLDEANIIGTAYLRADLLDKPYQTEVKRYLNEYVDIRLDAVNNGNIKEAILRSVELHKILWNQVSAAALANPGVNSSLMVSAINEVIDMHEQRVTVGLRYHIPKTVWLALCAISALSMITMGVQAGLTGARRLVAVVPMVLAFSALAVVVIDIDRPQTGTIIVGQEAMLNLQQSMALDKK